MIGVLRTIFFLVAIILVIRFLVKKKKILFKNVRINKKIYFGLILLPLLYILFFHTIKYGNNYYVVAKDGISFSYSFVDEMDVDELFQNGKLDNSIRKTSIYRALQKKGIIYFVTDEMRADEQPISLEITSKELVNQFEDNGVKIGKYKNKKIKVKGTISSIQESNPVSETFNKEKQLEVKLKGNWMKTVNCYFKNNSENLSIVSNFKKGQEIEVSGILKDDEGFGIVLKSCSIISDDFNKKSVSINKWSPNKKVLDLIFSKKIEQSFNVTTYLKENEIDYEDWHVALKLGNVDFGHEKTNPRGKPKKYVIDLKLNNELKKILIILNEDKSILSEIIE